MNTLRPVNIASLISLICLCAAPTCIGAPYAGRPAQTVEIVDLSWHDASRNRDVPVRMYLPARGKDPIPVVIFSHGLGGTRKAYGYLGRHWAEQGYASIHLQHIGSDDSVMAPEKQGFAGAIQALKVVATVMQNGIDRPVDVRFAIDQLEALNAGDGRLHGLFDLKHIAVAGHSFGGFTALAVAGEIFRPGGAHLQMADPRVSAIIEMSAPVLATAAEYDAEYGQIHIPCLHMTGTKDDSPVGETSAAERRVPFDHIPGPDQYLITFTGGDHFIFADRRRNPARPKDPVFHNLILQMTSAFLDAYLRDDTSAKKWLAEGECAAVVGANGKLEVKSLPPGK